MLRFCKLISGDERLLEYLFYIGPEPGVERMASHYKRSNELETPRDEL